MAETAAAAPTTFNVFFGNIPFGTTEETLKNLFPGNADLIDAKVIRRGVRSMGYGFVEFRTEAAAKAAVDAWNKKEIEGRPVNVEISVKKERATTAPAATAGAAAAAAAPATGDAAARGAAAGGARRGRFNRGPRAPRAPRAEGAAPLTGAAPVAAAPAAAAPAGERRPRAPRAARPARTPRAPVDPSAPREESKTLLFVGNLPFTVTDNQLKTDTFAGFEVARAYVVPGRREGRSKGYGFVELNSEAEADRALAAVQGKTVEDRTITVKRALKTDSAGPAAAATATA
ncbi:hypothetical protein CAOG_02736 [Capsaspora owczarzaki ATCC 30864]|uniref:RRM domain-containing protein n=1 Tax=Capsaspora owczarzaki (strain ATCC 30864) TaxID=595528 RepID=A0A0D2WMZ0_CAPO3|nr:hypothetical protein CAOG_02736 [Capsaspora owczarzaki ATCC 30864]KJE91623.1 hypothetical protein CAOG_002736 [Capsaspora owczarzaki ATCC 30864]|eukprot:XP_004349486.1 hypothetical protein CAOG_02736 [Capsaspora owczarzaki ATCC 30864]